MLDTDPTATVDDLEHDLADLDEVAPSSSTRTAGGDRGGRGGQRDLGGARAAGRRADRGRRPRRRRPRRARRVPAAGAAAAVPQAQGLRALPLRRRAVPGRAARRRRRPSPTMRISADYFAISGADRLVLRLDARGRPGGGDHRDAVVISGLGRYIGGGRAARQGDDPARPVHVGPGRRDDAAPAPERARRRPICRYLGPAFRTVLFEQDCQDTVPSPFASYNTGSLPSGGPARTLSAVTAYAEAACSCSRPARTTSSRRRRPANSLERRRAARVDDPALLALARPAPVGGLALPRAPARHRPEPLRDHVRPAGKAAAGPAVFSGIGGTTADARRLQLYTCIHELGTASTCSTRGRSRSRPRSRTGPRRRPG